jgi:hypothetical protein
LIMVVPDVTINRISSPSDACGLSATENLDLYLLNVGTDTLVALDTIPVNYQINSGLLIPDTLFVDQTVLPGDSILYSSSETIDLSNPGNYQFKVYAEYAEDLLTDNDTLNQSIEVFGNPSVSLGKDTAVNAKTYALDAGAGFVSYLWQDGSTDQNYSVTVGNQSADSIYHVTITDDNGCNSIDQVRVTFSFHDIGVSEILSPSSACLLTDLEELIVRIRNYGTKSIVGEQIQIIATLDDGTPVTGQKTLTQSLDPGDSLDFNFGNFDFSGQGDHDLVFYTVYARDIDVLNDSLIDIISHYGYPSIDLGSGEDTLATTLPYTLDAGADYISYTWNGIAGTRTNEAVAYGLYKLEVIDMNSCYAVDSVFLANNTSIGDPNLFDGSLRVYPNPTDNMLYIEYQAADGPNLILELFDALGRKVMVREYRHTSGIIESVDVSDMPKGVYYLRMRQNTQQAIRKIVIQ